MTEISNTMSPSERQSLDIVLAHFSSDSYREMFSEIMEHAMSMACKGVPAESLSSLAVDWPGSTIEFQRELVAAYRAWESTITLTGDESTKH